MRRKMKKQMTMETGSQAYTRLLENVIILTASLAVTASFEHTYDAAGVVCLMCPPGTYVDKHCSEDFTNSSCTPCPYHQFMSQWNKDTHCKGCKIANCPPNGVEVHACTPTTDRLCICQPGYHRFPVDPIDPQFECRQHSKCEPNEGVLTYGNHSHDTKCEQCLEGVEFVNRSDPQYPLCQKCTTCPDDSVTLQNCSIEVDTVCNSTINVVNINATTTPKPSPESDGLGAGHIAIIVLVVFLVIFIIIGFILYQMRTSIMDWWRRRNKDEELNETVQPMVTPPPLTEQNTEHEERNETEQGEPMVEQGEPMVEQGEPMVTPSWTEQNIERVAFPFLAKNLGGDWCLFIVQLNGWPKQFSLQPMIENKIEEEVFVPNRIFKCLSEWKKQAEPGYICRNSIVTALRRVDKEELVEGLDKLMKDSSSGPVENGNGHGNP